MKAEGLTGVGSSPSPPAADPVSAAADGPRPRRKTVRAEKGVGVPEETARVWAHPRGFSKPPPPPLSLTGAPPTSSTSREQMTGPGLTKYTRLWSGRGPGQTGLWRGWGAGDQETSRLQKPFPSHHVHTCSKHRGGNQHPCLGPHVPETAVSPKPKEASCYVTDLKHMPSGSRGSSCQGRGQAPVPQRPPAGALQPQTPRRQNPQSPALIRICFQLVGKGGKSRKAHPQGAKRCSLVS